MDAKHAFTAEGDCVVSIAGWHSIFVFQARVQQTSCIDGGQLWDAALGGSRHDR